MKRLQVFGKVLVTVSLAAFSLTACGTMSTGSMIRTPKDDPLVSISDKTKYAYVPLTGRMDAVEHLINEDLEKNGLESEGNGSGFKELRSIYDNKKDKDGWAPRKSNSIPLVKNEAVDRWIATFNGPLRDTYQRWLTRASYYGPLIESILKEEGVPSDLIYLSMIESGFNLNAYSHADAAGPWQFIQSTGKMYGLQSSGYVDDRRNIVKATRAAATHLRDLYTMYGDWYLAFAAYNAGPGGVNRAIKKAGSNDFWKLSARKTRYLHQETKDYVPKILAAAIIAKNYKKYGFSNEGFKDPINFDIVTVPGATDTDTIARCVDVSEDEIKNLNPSLVMGMTPPGMAYDIYLPVGTADKFKRVYTKLPKREKSSFATHVVKKRDTLASIAGRYGISKKKLAQANHLSLKAKPRAGVALVIPQKIKKQFARAEGDVIIKKTVGMNKAFAKKSKKELKLFGLKDSELTNSADFDLPADLDNGDNAAANQDTYDEPTIAQKTTQQEDANLHDLDNDKPFVGNNLFIKDANAAIPDQANTGDQQTIYQKKTINQKHVVKKGDTLLALSKRYGLNVQEIKRLNKLANNQIRPGQVLKMGQKVKTVAVTVAVPKPENSVEDLIANEATNDNQAQPMDDNVVALTENAQVPAQSKTVRVNRGDTLFSIAKRNGMTTTKLKELNNLSGNQVQAGQKLIVSAGQGNPMDVALNNVGGKKVVVHSVRMGQSLWEISQKYNVSIDQIREWNKLQDNILRANQKLKIYPQNEKVAFLKKGIR